MDKKEKRAVIKYFHMKGMSPKDIHEEMKSTMSQAPSYSTVKLWCSEFKRGRTTTEDAPRSGRPRDVTTDDVIKKVEGIVENNRRISIDAISQEASVSHGTAHSIVTDVFHMTKVSTL